jgi:quercetin dioxygenase-like cupin family protein
MEEHNGAFRCPASRSAVTTKEKLMPKSRIRKNPLSRNFAASSRRAGHPVLGLSGSFLQFDLAAESEQLRQEAAWKSTSRNAKTLVKYPDLRVVLIVMRSGTHMEGHKTDESISIQSLTGRLRLHLPEQVVELSAGGLLTLATALPHDVEALEDCAFLLTIPWPRGG